MKKLTPLHPLLILFIALLAAACSPGSSSGGTTHVDDFSSLVTAINESGAVLETGGSISQPFLNPEGQLIKVDGHDIQVFEYSDEGAAEADKATILPDGSTSTTMIFWIDTPHFYANGRVLVVYIGNDPAILQLLDQALGPQFAGG